MRTAVVVPMNDAQKRARTDGPRTIRGQSTIHSVEMAFAPGGRGPLPLPAAIGCLFVGPLLVWIAYRSATTDPTPVTLTCTRERADLIVCDPGNVRGPQVIARTQTGKNAKTCFTLGDTWMKCGGNVHGAAGHVNALAVGAKTDVDLTPSKESAYGIFGGAVFGVLVFAVGLHRLVSKGKPSDSNA